MEAEYSGRRPRPACGLALVRRVENIRFKYPVLISLLLLILIMMPLAPTSSPTRVGSGSGEPDRVRDCFTNSPMQRAEDIDTYVEGFENAGDPEDPDLWLPTGWSEYPYYGRTDWLRSGPGKVGFGCAAIFNYEIGSFSGILQSRTYDLSKTTWVRYSVWFRDIGIDNGDLAVWFKDKYGSWVLICDLNVAAGSPDPQNWRYYEITTSSSSYLHSSFAVRYYAKTITDAEKACIDLHTIACPNLVQKYAVLVAQTPGESANDVGKWAGRLTALFGFQSSNIHKLVSVDATRQNIIDHVTAVADTADYNDEIVFTFSGHGVTTDDQEGYFETYGSGYIWDHELYEYLRYTLAPIVFVFITCCYSGCFLDDFSTEGPQKTKFLVSTATTAEGTSFGLTGLGFTIKTPGSPTITMPYPGLNNIVHDNIAWTWFYTDDLTSGEALETTYSQGTASFRAWYNIPYHWEFVFTQPGRGYWQHRTDVWNWDEQPGEPGPLDGTPQLMDGNPTSSFYL